MQGWWQRPRNTQPRLRHGVPRWRHGFPVRATKRRPAERCHRCLHSFPAASKTSLCVFVWGVRGCCCVGTNLSVTGSPRITRQASRLTKCTSSLTLCVPTHFLIHGKGNSICTLRRVWSVPLPNYWWKRFAPFALVWDRKLDAHQVTLFCNS